MNILFIFLLALFLPITTMFSTEKQAENQTDLSETVESALVDKEEQPDQNTINQLHQEVALPLSNNKKGFKDIVFEFIKKYPDDTFTLSFITIINVANIGLSKNRNLLCKQYYPTKILTFSTIILAFFLQFLNKIYRDKNLEKFKLLVNEIEKYDFLSPNFEKRKKQLISKINKSKKIDLSLLVLEIFLAFYSLSKYSRSNESY